MKPFIIIDRFILNRVERLSHCLQKTFGLGCHKWAQLCYGAFIANVITWDLIPDVMHHKVWMIWLWIVTVPMYLFCYLRIMPELERLRDQLNELGIANSSKINPVSIASRCFNMFFMIFEFGFGNYDWGFNFLLISLSSYFGACDDLPPGKSRVRKFVDAIKAFGMKPVGVEQ